MTAAGNTAAGNPVLVTGGTGYLGVQLTAALLRAGTLRVLRVARHVGARRVVLTSSFAAIGYTSKPGAEFTEEDWTDPGTPGRRAWRRTRSRRRSPKRAAWDFAEREGGDIELVVVNPTFILGPTLTSTSARRPPGCRPRRRPAMTCPGR